MSAPGASRAGLLLGRRALLGGSLAALGARLPHLKRPSDVWRVAVVGLNGRGAEHLAALSANPNVRIVGLCDVDDVALARSLRRLRDQPRPGTHDDLRYLLERDDVDAITIATPDHWHALQAIWACQAGKDVYLEAPVTHVFEEGAPLLAAVQRHGRVVQCGLQARASTALGEALAWLRDGNLGKLELVRVLVYEPQPSIGKAKGYQRIPETVDYDLWCGPAPLVPLRRERLHHDWRWSFATGSGALGMPGVHLLDLARQVLGDEGLPPSVLSLGLRAGDADDGETPNTQLVYFAHEPLPILCEVRGLPHDAAARAGDWSAGMDAYLGLQRGVVVHCEGGSLRLDLGGTAGAFDPDGRALRRFEGRTLDPFANWVEACRARRPADLLAGLEGGVHASGLVHLANASHQVGRGLQGSDVLGELASSERLTAATERMFAHLEANGLDLAKTRFTLGPCLVLEPGRGRFVAHDEANALLQGTYREPFTLPAVGS